MSDWESLALIVALIYVGECLFWVRADAIALCSPWRGRCRILRSEGPFSNAYGSLLLSNPLPPLGRVVLCRPWPISLSPEGLWAPSRPGEDAPEVRRFEDFKRADADGKWLRLDGKRVAHCGSIHLAAVLAGLLQELKRTPRDQRPARLETRLRATLDADQAGKRAALLNRQTALLVWVCNALFAYFFTVIILWVWVFSLLAVWPLALALLMAGTASASALFFRAHRNLYPAESAQRWSQAILMLVSPLSAIRAVDLLERDAFAAFHPLAAAGAIGLPGDFRNLARETLAEIEFAPATQEGPAAAGEEWRRKRLRTLVRELLKEEDCKPEALLAPPERDGRSSRTYCPRCLSQYTLAAGVCQDCGGLQLQRLL